MNKVAKGLHIDPFNVNQEISGFTYVNPELKALKYGRGMEDIAANGFFEVMKEGHKNLKLTNCGLFLDETAPVIGATPDRLMTCDCCPPSCVEIKCPYSINYTSPLDDKVSLPYIKNKQLNRKHPYFTQCMVQMGVTKVTHSYFMVWTPHGHMIEHILFDDKLWTEMKQKLVSYYEQFYLPTIYHEL